MDETETDDIIPWEPSEEMTGARTETLMAAELDRISNEELARMLRTLGGALEEAGAPKSAATINEASRRLGA